MSKIKVMDEILANKIAAGEVVERCSSVVKELVENSIDAGSKNIKVELILSGMKMIKVTDDGSGMDKTDAVNCFLRHATSKIKTENDLPFINTLGFRGEALASIASVSEVVLKTSDEKEGTEVHINGGKLDEVKNYELRKGTIIEVNNLFYNTPARLKFLKTPQSELYNIVSLMEKIALSEADIAFSLYNDERLVLKTNGSGDLLKTIHEIYGLNVSKHMVYIEGANEDYLIKGYVSDINVYRSNRNHMTIFVNNRIIKNNFINKIIKDAYHTFLAENKFPIVVLNIEVDPTIIDVNIHPTKQDIKLGKTDMLEDLLFNLIRNKLNNTDNKFVVKGEVNKPVYEESYTEEYIINDDLVNYEKIENVTFDFSNDGREEIKETHEREKEIFYPVGLVMGTYLICQKEEEMEIIDIHAANERINYEKFLNALKEEKISTTEMLFPVVIEYSHEESLKLKEMLDKVTKMGIKIEEFGINTYKISGHPTWLLKGYEEESIKRILDLFINSNGNFDRVKFNEQLAINLACKMSVKANTNISYTEMEELVCKLLDCEFPYTCPHGRPTILKYPKYELEKLFKRVNS